MIREGNASPPWLTKYAGPTSGTGISGVTAFACPTTDAAGQPAGFVLNCAAVHAFCNVVRREGSCFGRSTLTEAMFDCAPGGKTTFASRLAPRALDVFPDVETLNLDRKSTRLNSSHL